MKILDQKITVEELTRIFAATFGDMVKAVVDIDRGVIAIDAELHADLESLLLENGSAQKNLWGINFYPGQEGNDFIEFDSMINIRPSQGNLSRGVDREEHRKKIVEVVERWVKR